MNRILGIPLDEFEICKRIGYGARNTVYEVQYAPNKRAAVKFLIQNSEEN